jgi:hypothetical protein
MVSIANFVMIAFFSYYIHFFIDLLNVKNRRKVQFANRRMDELRKIPIKSELEQKEFIGLKYPVGSKGKWTFRRITIFFFTIIFYLGIFVLLLKIFGKYNIQFRLWQALLIVFVSPTLINLLLKRFGLEKNDITIFFR